MYAIKGQGAGEPTRGQAGARSDADVRREAEARMNRKEAQGSGIKMGCHRI